MIIPVIVDMPERMAETWIKRGIKDRDELKVVITACVLRGARKELGLYAEVSIGEK